MECEKVVLETEGYKMKRIFIVFFWITSLLFLGCASDRQPATPADKTGNFRRACWGMDRVQVEAVEKSALPAARSPESQLIYEGKLLGKIKVEIIYHFEDGKLKRGTYRVTEPGGIMEYTIFRILLNKKYGKPYSIDRIMTMAESSWLTPETEIDLWAEGTGLDRYDLSKPEDSLSIALNSLEINYYDRNWFAHDIKRTVKEESRINESEQMYQKLIGDWVEIYPSYRGYLDMGMMLEPGEEYVYDPEYYDDF